jgi:hypothetical protein
MKLSRCVLLVALIMPLLSSLNWANRTQFARVKT